MVTREMVNQIEWSESRNRSKTDFKSVFCSLQKVIFKKLSLNMWFTYATDFASFTIFWGMFPTEVCIFVR